jgi:hypothetical protein
MSDEARVTVERLRAAMEARDHAAVVSLFAPDIVLNSPILRTRFEGVDALSDLYAAIIETFTDYRYTAQMEGDGQQLLAFSGAIRGVKLQGVDFVEVDEEGRITEMTVIIRPLAGVIAFLIALGPPLARRRGRLQALAMRIAGPPLMPIAKLVDWLAPRMVHVRKP